MNFAVRVRLASSFFAMVLVLLSRNTGFAQVTASLTGRVEDPSGAGIPETNVTVTSLETGATRTVTSDEGGSYQILSLPVGRYDMKAEKELSGTVATVKFVNPHGSMSIMVKNETGGGETEWVFTLGSATPQLLSIGRELADTPA